MAAHLRIRFTGTLNAFLPPARRDVSYEHAVLPRASVKDVIESLGPPHTEVGRIEVGGEPVGLDYHVRDGDDIVVFPYEPGRVARPPRFLLDTHLGTLARDLRLLGLDAAWDNHADDADLARRAHDERRVLLTRDLGLLKRGIVDQGYFLRETIPERQLAEVVRRYHLLDHVRPFSRCPRCNHPLQRVAKAEVEHRLPPRTRASQTCFTRCSGCGRVYWPGTHYEHMLRRMRDYLPPEPSVD